MREIRRNRTFPLCHTKQSFYLNDSRTEQDCLRSCRQPCSTLESHLCLSYLPPFDTAEEIKFSYFFLWVSNSNPKATPKHSPNAKLSHTVPNNTPRHIPIAKLELLSLFFLSFISLLLSRIRSCLLSKF